MKKLFGFLFVPCFLFIGLGACGEAEELYNCAKLCETYGDCAEELGAEADEIACIDQCETKADQDEGFAQAADRCSACLDAVDTCTENFPCVTECTDVLPDVVF